jgi:hypothetical protein
MSQTWRARSQQGGRWREKYTVMLMGVVLDRRSTCSYRDRDCDRDCDRDDCDRDRDRDRDCDRDRDRDLNTHDHDLSAVTMTVTLNILTRHPKGLCSLGHGHGHGLSWVRALSSCSSQSNHVPLLVSCVYICVRQ